MPQEELVSCETFQDPDLRQERVGTQGFFPRVPERRREEVFVEYRNGASLEPSREMVVNRYPNPWFAGGG